MLLLFLVTCIPVTPVSPSRYEVTRFDRPNTAHLENNNKTAPGALDLPDPGPAAHVMRPHCCGRPDPRIPVQLQTNAFMNGVAWTACKCTIPVT